MEKQKFVEKEEYLNQYIENGYWVIFHNFFSLAVFFNNVSCQGVSEEIKERRVNVIKKIRRYYLDSIRYKLLNNLHRTNCLRLEKKHVTTLLQPNVVEIPI